MFDEDAFGGFWGVSLSRGYPLAKGGLTVLNVFCSLVATAIDHGEITSEKKSEREF